MAGLTPLPRTHLHSSTRLTHKHAHDLLSSFLEEAQTNPSYRPDAILTQHGPQASSVGEGSNLTLNHLGRIMKGIAGQRVGGVEFNYGDGRGKRRKIEHLTGNVDSGAGLASSPPAPENLQHGNEQVVDVEVEGGDQAAVVGQETGDWQNKEDYDYAQVNDVVDVGGRDPAAEGIEGRADDLEVATLPGGELSKAEKEARKQAKKDKRKKEKQDGQRKPKKDKARRSSG